MIIMIIMLPGHHGVPQFSNRGSLAHCSSPDASAQRHQPDPCFRQLSPPLLPLLPSFHPTSRTTSLRRCRATFRWCFRASEAKRLDNNGDLQRGQPSLSSFQRTEVDLPCQHGDLRVKWKWEQRYERRSHQWICKVGGRPPRPTRPTRPTRPSGTQRTQRCGPPETT